MSSPIARHGVSEGLATMQSALAKAALDKANARGSGLSEGGVDLESIHRITSATATDTCIENTVAMANVEGQEIARQVPQESVSPEFNESSTPETPALPAIDDAQHNILPDLNMLVGIVSPASPPTGDVPGQCARDEALPAAGPSFNVPVAGIGWTESPRNSEQAPPDQRTTVEPLAAGRTVSPSTQALAPAPPSTTSQLPDLLGLTAGPGAGLTSVVQAPPAPPAPATAGPTIAVTPKPAAAGVHMVAVTDTLPWLAVKYGTTPAAIRRANNMMSSELISYQTLKVPVPGEVYPPVVPIVPMPNPNPKRTRKSTTSAKKATKDPAGQRARPTTHVPSKEPNANTEAKESTEEITIPSNDAGGGAGWTARRQRTTESASEPPPVVSGGTVSDFSEDVQKFARDADAANPEVQTQMLQTIELVLRQGSTAEVIRSKLRTFHSTAVAHQTAAIELARCLADNCDAFQTTGAPLAKSAVVVHEIAALQREMNTAVEDELSRVDDLIADFATTKKAVKAWKSARSKASSARDNFLAAAPEGKGGQTHQARGLTAAETRRAAEMAQLKLLEVVGRVGTINHIGVIDTVQGIAGAVLQCAVQTARVSIADDRASLNTAQIDASQALHNVRQTLQMVETELANVHKIDVASLQSGNAMKASEDVIKQSAERVAAAESCLVDEPTCTFDSAFKTGELVGEISDAEFLAQAAVGKIDRDACAVMMSARRGTLLTREKVLGISVWRPAYFECHGYTLRKIDGKGRRTVVAVDLRNCKVDAAVLQADGTRIARPFVFQLVKADTTRYLMQTQSAREFATWFTTLEQMTLGIPAEAH